MKGKSKYFGTNFAKMDRIPAVPDEESPEVTRAMMARGTVKIGDIVIRGPKKPGRPLGSGKKESIHVMFDKDILAYYRSTGPGWQTRMNDALRAYLPKGGRAHARPKPAKLRRITRAG